MSPLAGYIADMRELCASAPDRRTGANARLEMADIGMAAFRRLLPAVPVLPGGAGAAPVPPGPVQRPDPVRH